MVSHRAVVGVISPRARPGRWTRSVARVVIVCLVVTKIATGVATPASAVAVNKIMVVGDSISQGSANDFTWRYRLYQHLQQTAPGATNLVGDRTDIFDNVRSQQGSQAYRDPNFDTEHHAQWGRLLTDEKSTIRSAVTNADFRAGGSAQR